MRRRAVRLAWAAVIGLIALSLLSGVATGDSGGSSGAPKALTHHFPLGTQTLSHTESAPASGSATTPHRATATTPHRATASSPQRRATAPAAHRQTHGGEGFPSLALLALIPVLIAVVLQGRALMRRSRRTDPYLLSPPRQNAIGRGEARWTRSTAGARWTYVDNDEVEQKPPPLPVRRRAK